VKDHSNADFTHGYCPACAEKFMKPPEKAGDGPHEAN
jgi:hypothetical protein